MDNNYTPLFLSWLFVLITLTLVYPSAFLLATLPLKYKSNLPLMLTVLPFWIVFQTLAIVSLYFYALPLFFMLPFDPVNYFLHWSGEIFTHIGGGGKQ